MYDITLYGHLTVDRIIEDGKETTSLGSIANVWSALVELDSKMKIGISPLYYGEALIYVDKFTSNRYSKAKLNLRTEEVSVKPSKINHFLYINEFDDFSFFENVEGIITADVCTGRKINIDVLKYIDVLFISDEDLDDINILKDNIKGKIVLHKQHGSVCYDRQDTYAYHIPQHRILKNINVLGAGDMFAACFLFYMLKHPDQDIQTTIKQSHLQTSNLLLRANEKI